MLPRHGGWVHQSGKARLCVATLAIELPFAPVSAVIWP
jgi:hypothetical protein